MKRVAAFTLLEMLVTLAVGTLLLATVWELLSMYTRLFDAGKTKAGSTQLISGITGQLSDDLKNAIGDVAPPMPGTPGTPRRFGFFGDAHTLQIDVMQSTFPRPDLSGGSATGSDATSDSQDLTVIPQAYELRTIRYSFVDPATVGDTGAGDEIRTGLVRREFDFETPYEVSTDDTSGSTTTTTSDNSTTTTATSGDDSDSEPPPPELALLDGLPIDVNDESVTWMPEIIRLEFRYFDGTTWNTTWSSLQQKALPVAVEVVLDFRFQEAPPGSTDASGGTSTSSGSSTTSTASSGGTSSSSGDTGSDSSDDQPVVVPGVVTRRYVFLLPHSPLQQPVGQSSGTDSDTGAVDASAPGPSAGGFIDPTTFADSDDPTMDDPLLFNAPAGGTTDDRRSRFQFSRRAAASAQATSQPAATKSAPDQWIRLGQ